MIPSKDEIREGGTAHEVERREMPVQLGESEK